ncbi:bifunctional phosphoribosylaminoimidazolecarboxamide formyltransferase/IMP cyclohydrolase [Catenisphaera adipataccumulans]|uniref:Bifunctional purine biosynthesis protein PurH n=1 Tax=Catenisphaera adipataccumulans TaxID=700500 RepID=A0A7W8FUT6_9FIRM|nr:bifunctional phosphoribosylaminoimidazolecarboxamide formyltransferase/IMP cyclohydrolase [Catenisphaera adipataccumulans]MBB5182438.1 phosphoribosylaminoimidazolecarboxamide formyltransferase/IMP cyclohydrolase [Catenisphaera adipataccumulans]
MKRALVSVSDKTGIVDFVKGLKAAGYEIISTGGTKKALDEAGLAPIGISEVTGFPEILDGRVKTLHPKVHGGLLAVRSNPDHMAQLKELNIECIDLVCVNLYPFKQTVQKEDVSHEEIIENIDIGGPSMLRSASKNYQSVTVVTDPADYDKVLNEIQTNGDTTLATREALAAKVFRTTAQYDAMIADYLTKKEGNEFPEKLTITFDKVQDLRYGENPHQKAAFYKGMKPQYSLANAQQLHGKELSYNNIQDGNAAIEILKDFEGQHAAIGLKHMNPCGIGIGSSIEEAWDKCFEADSVSIFGGIVAFNDVVNVAVAEKLSKIFLEIVIAPDFEPEAFKILTKKKNIRLLKLDVTQEVNNKFKYTNVNDGLLVQELDTKKITKDDLKCVTDRKPTEEEIDQLLFAWKVVKHVKSNAIVLVKDNMTVGVGAGQMNRVGAAEIAIKEAGEKAKGSVLASDAFFPYRDTVDAAIKAGVTAVIQPGGSIRDQESIDACNEAGIAMVYTGVRHFKH